MADYDLTVARVAYQTAAAMGASPKVLQALFEAGIVESGFRNLTHATDHDSLGYLQQRPSMGWPNPTDVPTATRSFVDRAKANESRYGTPGQLAQSVQRSAFPAKYDQASTAAADLLKKVGAGGSGPDIQLTGFPNPLGAAGDLVGAVQDAAGALHDMAGGVVKAGQLATALTKLALPSNALRLAMGVLGIVFVFIGIIQLGKEVRRQ